MLLALEEYIKDFSKLKTLSPGELFLLMRQYSDWRRANRTGMPDSAVKALCDAVPDSVMADIVSDARRTNEPKFLKRERREPVVRGSGWQRPVGLEGSVPGIKLMDQMMDVADAVDRRELKRKLEG